MSKVLTHKGRKMWVANNFIAIAILLIAHLRNESLGMNYGYLGIEIFALVIISISFFRVFWKTGLWRLTHTSLKNVDERQAMVINNALRWSYSVFTILTISIFYFYALYKSLNVSLVLMACLLYTAHILPASIIAWTEKEM